MTLAEAKGIIANTPDSKSFYVHFKVTATGRNDQFPPKNANGLGLKEAERLSRAFYKSSHGRYHSIEVKHS